MAEPPTWSELERALYHRLCRWADTIPNFHDMSTPQVLPCLEWFENYLPNLNEQNDIRGLMPGACDELINHLIRHLQRRAPLREPCLTCQPLPQGIRVGRDGNNVVKVFGPTGIIAPYHPGIGWRMAQCSSPAALEALKQRILKGDEAVAAKEISNG